MQRKERNNRITFSQPTIGPNDPDPEALGTVKKLNLSFQATVSHETISITTTIIKNGEKYEMTGQFTKMGLVYHDKTVPIAAVYKKEDIQVPPTDGQQENVQPLRLKLRTSKHLPKNYEREITGFLRETL